MEDKNCIVEAIIAMARRKNAMLRRTWNKEKSATPVRDPDEPLPEPSTPPKPEPGVPPGQPAPPKPGKPLPPKPGEPISKKRPGTQPSPLT
jgi:hypothetical protein